jgi:hypothetical protein
MPDASSIQNKKRNNLKDHVMVSCRYFLRISIHNNNWGAVIVWQFHSDCTSRNSMRRDVHIVQSEITVNAYPSVSQRSPRRNAK